MPGNKVTLKFEVYFIKVSLFLSPLQAGPIPATRFVTNALDAFHKRFRRTPAFFGTLGLMLHLTRTIFPVETTRIVVLFKKKRKKGQARVEQTETGNKREEK